MHYQRAPFEEASWCAALRGRDLRRRGRPAARLAKTFRRWHGVELTADTRRMLYIPAGCAHGFQTLTDDAEVLYLIDTPYIPRTERRPLERSGVRYQVASGGAADHAPRDAGYPDFSS